MADNQPAILHDNRLDDGTPAASTTAAGFSVLNLRDWRPYTWWKPTILPASVTVDCGSAKSADYCLVWGHDLFTQGCTVEVRGSTDNFAASNVLIAGLTPTSNKPFLIQFASASYRYWRLTFTGGAIMPSIAIAVIGTKLMVPAWFEDGFDPRGRTAKGQFNRSVEGHPLGRITEYEEWSETLKFPLVNGSSGWTWLRNNFEPAWTAHLRDEPWVLVWDPDGHPTELMLVVAKDKFSSPHKSGGLMDLDIPVTGVFSA